jgi:hypothetical protein
MDNMLSNVNNYNLVIYTDENSCSVLQRYCKNPRIKMVILPHESFYTYQYKDHWVRNHEKNISLNARIDWKVNMLWSEKIHFVQRTIQNQYFQTDWYGWCDIGYFRNRPFDLSKQQLLHWPSADKIRALDKERVHYALVNNNVPYINQLYRIVTDKNEVGLPRTPIPVDQFSVAGGFFICHKDKIKWWADTFDAKLRLYFENDALVKDDQIVILDCVFSEMSQFHLHREENRYLDPWFLFQRALL